MFSLKDFFSITKKGYWIDSLLLFFSIFISFIIMLVLGLEKNRILIFVSTALVFFCLIYIRTHRIYARFLKEHSDVISYIFLREYTGSKKYDVNKHFTTTEIEKFVQNLDCENYIEFNNIPKEYYYKKNHSYLILEFEKENLKHYTRSIPWSKISWKYAHINNDGFYEFLRIQYKNDCGIEIDEEIITERISQKSFHIFLMFILYDLKYGKRISLSKNNYKRKRPFKILGLSNSIS